MIELIKKAYLKMPELKEISPYRRHWSYAPEAFILYSALVIESNWSETIHIPQETILQITGLTKHWFMQARILLNDYSCDMFSAWKETPFRSQLSQKDTYFLNIF